MVFSTTTLRLAWWMILLGNPPVSVQIRVRPTTGTPAFDPGPNGSPNTWSQSAAAFNNGFASGGTYTQIANSLLPFGVNFAPPSFTNIAGNDSRPNLAGVEPAVPAAID